MNYKKSKLLLREIKNAGKILVNCHRNPDPDSIGSALGLRRVLLAMNKKVEIICPSKTIDESVNYLSGYDQIKKGIDFSKFNFTEFDLFAVLDSSSWDMVANRKDLRTPMIKTLVIDHHATNTSYGQINLLDKGISSTGEMLFLIIEDWGILPDKDTVDCIMAAMVGDTGAFRFPGVNGQTFEVAGKLMDLGADKNKAIHEIYRSGSFNLLKFYGEVLARLEIDKKRRFVWSAVPYEIYSKLDKPETAKESAASMFTQVVKGTDFGFVAVEVEPKSLSISFRSRSGLDISKIASELGGGGHVYASGAKVEGLEFDKAVEKVLEVAKKYAKKNPKRD